MLYLDKKTTMLLRHGASVDLHFKLRLCKGLDAV